MKTCEKLKNSLLGKSLLYCLVTFIANFVSFNVVLKCVTKVIGFLFYRLDASPAAINVVSMLMLVTLDLLIVLGIVFVFIRIGLPPLYEEGNSKLWLKKSAFLILPGEILRFVFSLTDLGFIDRSGKFTLVPACLFELLYSKNHPDRLEIIRQHGEFAFFDCIFYTLCYISYFAVFLAFVFLLCSRVWSVYGKDYEDL